MFTRIFLFSFFFVSSLAVKECYLYSPMMPEEDVRECKNEWTHDVEKHGCYYAFNLDSSASQVGAIQGTCASYSCRTGVDQCTVSTSDLEKLALSLMNTTTKEDAVCLQTAVKGLGTDEKVLTEILTTRTNEELAAIKNTYLSNFKKSLEEAVAADTSGDYKKLLLTILQGIRDEGNFANSARVREAVEILSTPADKKEKHEKYAVLGAANFHELAQILDGVQLKTGKSLEEQIKRECSGDFKDAVTALYRIAAHGKPRFFADQIQTAVKGFGTNTKDLIRILVSRSENDLEDIKDVYQAVYGKKLEDTLKEECKGAYQHALLSLVRGNKNLTA